MRPLAFASTAGLAFLIATNSVDARPVTITAQMNAYYGPRAYAAIYLTDPAGKVVDTLLVAGRKGKYYRHLRDWSRGRARTQTKLHGITGASVGSGGRLRVSVDIADNLIEAGYQVRIDTSVEDQNDRPRSAVLTLGRETSVSGRGIVRSLSLD